MMYGYARVSSDGQDYASQVEALERAGCTVVAEKRSGKALDGRKELQKLMARVERDDVIAVTKLDRFARNTRELLNMLHELEGRGVGFKSLGDPIDTTSPQGRLVTQIFAAIAEFERETIRERCRVGLERAKAKGRPLGRKPKLDARQRDEVNALQADGMSQRAIARLLKVDQSTISRSTT
jgi:DNA invertase Pin-like site-specific DNA recombinase